MSAFEDAKPSQAATVMDVDWESTYQELLPKVYHYFCLRTGSRPEAEDLTAETFERAWRDRERYRKDLGGFKNWLFGIARHVAITHFRKDHKENPATQQGKVELSRLTEEAATHQQEFEKITAILVLLAEREREIFSLKYGARFTNRSIAKEIGISETNVGTIINRIIKRLREQSEKENE